MCSSPQCLHAIKLTKKNEDGNLDENTKEEFESKFCAVERITRTKLLLAGNLITWGRNKKRVSRPDALLFEHKGDWLVSFLSIVPTICFVYLRDGSA